MSLLLINLPTEVKVKRKITGGVHEGGGGRGGDDVYAIFFLFFLKKHMS